AVAPGAGLPSGKLLFFVDGVPSAQGPVDLFNGQTSFATAALAASPLPHTIRAEYAGDGNFAAAAGVLSDQLVAKADTPVSLPSPRPTPAAGRAIVFTATVAAPPGAPLPAGAVAFTVDNVPQAQRPLLDAFGHATLSVSLTAGTHTIVATYQGSGNYNGSAQT